MSMWTVINGVISVHPMGNTQAQMRYILETVLNHLPRVTGSEVDMDVYIVQPSGHDCSQSCDEFGQSTDNLVDDWGAWPVKSRNGWMRMQSEYLLVVNGRLRDRVFDETKRAFMRWLTRLAKRVHVYDLCVSVSGYDGSMVLTDGEPFEAMFEDPSWSNDTGEPTWCEFMLYDTMPGNRWYPMLLGYKYYEDPENDAEVERRMAFRSIRNHE